MIFRERILLLSKLWGTNLDSYLGDTLTIAGTDLQIKISVLQKQKFYIADSLVVDGVNFFSSMIPNKLGLFFQCFTYGNIENFLNISLNKLA